MNFDSSEQKIAFNINKIISKFLKIENQERSKLEGIFSLGIYATDYIIILTIIILQNHNVLTF